MFNLVSVFFLPRGRRWLLKECMQKIRLWEAATNFGMFPKCSIPPRSRVAALWACHKRECQSQSVLAVSFLT